MLESGSMKVVYVNEQAIKLSQTEEFEPNECYFDKVLEFEQTQYARPSFCENFLSLPEILNEPYSEVNQGLMLRKVDPKVSPLMQSNHEGTMIYELRAFKM